MPDRDDAPAPDGAATPTGPNRVDYPHDENYRPGYHEGGSRFGFFNGHDDADPASPGEKAPKKP
jgi:hypothetical protein